MEMNPFIEFRFIFTDVVLIISITHRTKLLELIKVKYLNLKFKDLTVMWELKKENEKEKEVEEGMVGGTRHQSFLNR